MQKKDAKSCVFIPALVRAEQNAVVEAMQNEFYTRPCKGGTSQTKTSERRNDLYPPL